MRRRFLAALVVPVLALSLAGCTLTITGPVTSGSANPAPTDGDNSSDGSVLKGTPSVDLLPDDAGVQATFAGYTSEDGAEPLQDPNPIGIDPSSIPDASTACQPALQPFVASDAAWPDTALVVYESPDGSDAVTWLVARASDAQAAHQFVTDFSTALKSCTDPDDPNVWGFPGGVKSSAVPGAVGWGSDGYYGAFVADGDLVLMVSTGQSDEVDPALQVQLDRLSALG